MMCESVPGLDEPAAFVDMKLVPFISQIAGLPSLPCHRMSDLPSPLKSPALPHLKEHLSMAEKLK
jgi:hypothetical protein